MKDFVDSKNSVIKVVRESFSEGMPIVIYTHNGSKVAGIVKAVGFFNDQHVPYVAALGCNNILYISPYGEGFQPE